MSRLFIFLRKLLSTRKGVVFIILRPDNTSLLQLRDGNSKIFPHTWCWPGGASDPEEDFIDTAVREVGEEYEIVVRKENIDFLMSRYFGKQKVFICKVPQDVTPIMHEGADMKWMSIDEIKLLSLGYYQEDILKRLKKYLNNT